VSWPETSKRLARPLLLIALLFAAALWVEAAPELHIPFHFEANRGQASPDVRFIARGDGYRIALGEAQNQILLRRMSVTFRFAGSTPGIPFSGESQLEGRVNYLHGRRSSSSLLNIPTFARVRQNSVYPGIDVVYYGNSSRLEYDVIVSPRGDPGNISIRFGQTEHLSIDTNGDLHIRVGDDEIIQRRPVASQGARHIDAAYKLVDSRTVRFEIGNYDRSRTLVIDPILTYSTFIGGSDGDQNAHAIVTDLSGNIYVAGSTTATNFPTVNALQPKAGSMDSTLGFSDAFILKLNPSGSALIYSTYLGGSDDDDAVAIALDSSNNVIVTGTTTSTDFPATANAFRRQCTIGASGTCADAFVAKLNGTGSALVFATYLGGSDDEESRAVGVDSAGNVYVAGETLSTDFPMAGTPYSTTASQGAFIAKLGPAGNLVASTYFGVGAGTTDIRALAADSVGNVYVTGATPQSNASATDVFVAKMTTSLSAIVYSSFIRGSNNETGNGIAIDSAGNAFVTGRTYSRNFVVTAGAPQPALSGGPAFKTSDGGSHWTQTATTIPRTSLYALAVAPGVIYVGTDDEIAGGIYESVDGGSTWTEADAGLNVDSRVHALAVDPQNASSLYAGTRSAGIYKSSDGGRTWAATGLNNVFVTSIAIDPSNSVIIYAGTDGGGVFKTTNGGSNWDVVNNGLTSLGIQTIAIDPSTTSTIYIGTPAGLFKSTDGAVTWNSSGAGLFDPNMNTLVIDPRNPKLLFAGTNSTGIFRSLNGGSGWLAANSGIPSSSSGIEVTAITIDPTTGTLFAAAGESNALTIYKSLNGTTWTSTGLGTTRVSSLAIDRTASNTVYAATIGGSDAFVSKWDSSGALAFSTYLGGYRDDSGNGVAVDQNGNLYVTGTTSSTNFPTVNALQPTFGGGSDIVTDAFVAKINPAAPSLSYTTYLGGTNNDFGNAITVDSHGSVYVAGQTGSSDFPTESPLMSSTNSLAAFVAQIMEVTAVPFSVTARGGYTSSTQGSGSLTAVGFGRITPNGGSTTPQGTAIFGFRSNNVLVSEAAVPASPAISSGRLYVEVGSSIDTGLAIANPNAQPVTLSFYLTDNSGGVTQGSTTVTANNQIAAFIDQAPFNAGTSFKGTLTFTASAPVAVVALRGRTNERGEFLITTLPVVDLSAAPATGGSGVVFPHYADGGGWTTQVVLVNPTDNALSGSLQFYSQGGQLVGSASAYSVPARGSFTLQTPGTSNSVQVGSIRVTPAGANDPIPSGVAIFSLRNNGVVVTEAGVPAVTAGSAFRLYAESSGFFTTASVGSMQTGVAVVNLSGTATTVNFDLTALNGAAIAGRGSVSTTANGQTALFLDQVPGLSSLPNPLKAVLRVSSSAQIAVIGLRGRYNERKDFLITTTPPSNESIPAPTSELFFPHFADGGGYTTQFILFNGSADIASSGTIRFFTQTGQALSLPLR
jgi:hypothetical protein